MTAPSDGRVGGEAIPRSKHDEKYRAVGLTEYYCAHCLSAWFAGKTQECIRCLRSDGVRALEREATK